MRLDGQERSLRVVALIPPTIVGTVLLLPTGIVPDQGGPRTYVIDLAEGADGSAVAAELAAFGAVATTTDWISRSAAEQERMSVAAMVALLGVATTGPLGDPPCSIVRTLAHSDDASAGCGVRTPSLRAR